MFVTITIAGQLFGIPTIQVQDAHDTPKVTPVPLAPREVAGVLNLRGKIVTVINLRERLNLAPVGSDETTMSIVVEHGGDLYSLVIDDVGDVLSLPDDQFEKCPATMDPLWREIAVGRLSPRRPADDHDRGGPAPGLYEELHALTRPHRCPLSRVAGFSVTFQR